MKTAGSSLTPKPESTIDLDGWYPANTFLPSNIGLVRAFNGRNVQKCFYDAGKKKWYNQHGEEIQVIKWKVIER